MSDQKPPRQSWESLNRGSTIRPAGSTDDDDAMVLAATTSGSGRLLMDWLRETYIEHLCRQGASEAELREAEACRRLVHRLEDMRDRAAEKARTKA